MIEFRFDVKMYVLMTAGRGEGQITLTTRKFCVNASEYLVPAWPKDTFETKFDDREDSSTKEMQALIPGSYAKRS